MDQDRVVFFRLSNREVQGGAESRLQPKFLEFGDHAPVGNSSLRPDLRLPFRKFAHRWPFSRGQFAAVAHGGGASGILNKIEYLKIFLRRCLQRLH